MTMTIPVVLWGQAAGSALAGERPENREEVARVFIDDEVQRMLPTARALLPRINIVERNIDGLSYVGYRIIASVELESGTVSPEEMRTLACRVEAAVSVGLLELLPTVSVEFVGSQPEIGGRGRIDSRPLREDRGE